MGTIQNTLTASGLAASNVVVNTAIATIATPGKGRWQVWGMARHSLNDGCALVVGSTVIIANISASANNAEPFGPLILDILNNTDSIILRLAIATGASDNASATIYAQRAYAI